MKKENMLKIIFGGLLVIILAIVGTNIFIKNTDVNEVVSLGEGYINNEYNQNEMTSVSGEVNSNFDSDKMIVDIEGGIAIYYDENIKKLIDENILTVVPDQEGGYVYIFLDENLESEYVTDEDIHFYMSIFSTSTGSNRVDSMKNIFEEVVKIGETSYSEYFFAYNRTIKSDKFKENEELITLIDALDNMMNNIYLFPRVEVPQNQIPSFEAETLSGETVTNDIFKDYDITMINIWATYCEPCRDEMPELQSLYEQLTENTNMITICMDAEYSREVANEIISVSNGEFLAIIPDSNLENFIGRRYNAIPTTIFVDSDGNVIGDPIVGAPPLDRVVEVYKGGIENALEIIEQ